MRDLLFPILLGAAGGVVAGAGIWLYASRSLDHQLTAGHGRLTAGLSTGGQTLEARLAAGERQLEQQIRTEVAASIDGQFRAYGVTPARMQTIWAAASRTGLVGAR